VIGTLSQHDSDCPMVEVIMAARDGQSITDIARRCTCSARAAPKPQEANKNATR
jgi:hypothetical protein